MKKILEKGSLCHYYRDEPLLDNNGAIADFSATFSCYNFYFPNSASFKFKTKIAGEIENNGTKNGKIRVPLRYSSNIGRTLEMHQLIV